VFTLRHELYQYLTGLSHDSAYIFNNSDSNGMKLAYLSDLSEKLTTLNALQCGESDTVQLSDKLKYHLLKNINCGRGN